MKSWIANWWGREKAKTSGYKFGTNPLNSFGHLKNRQMVLIRRKCERKTYKKIRSRREYSCNGFMLLIEWLAPMRRWCSEVLQLKIQTQTKLKAAPMSTLLSEIDCNHMFTTRWEQIVIKLVKPRYRRFWYTANWSVKKAAQGGNLKRNKNVVRKANLLSWKFWDHFSASGLLNIRYGNYCECCLWDNTFWCSFKLSILSHF